jgi:hypothetical protein
VSERDHLEGLGIDRSIILKSILKGIVWEGMGCIHQGQGWDQWQAFANMVMNPWFPNNTEFVSQMSNS